MRPAPGGYILQRLQGECYTLAMSKAGEDYFMNPPPGSAAARAVEFGIDLTLTVENLRLTPEQRIRQLDDHIAGIAKLRATAKRLGRTPPSHVTAKSGTSVPNRETGSSSR
jgi:hypothetical protein